MSGMKPCPFCGKEDLYFEQDEEGETNIVCDWCEYKTRIFQTIGDAARWWNTRPIEDDLRKRIAELEWLVDELKPYREGYDAYENPPEEGETVIANLGSWIFLAQRRGDKWYDSLGQQAEIRGGVERWWKLPEVQE